MIIIESQSLDPTSLRRDRTQLDILLPKEIAINDSIDIRDYRLFLVHWNTHWRLW